MLKLASTVCTKCTAAAGAFPAKESLCTDCAVLQMLEARHMIVRNKLLVPLPAGNNHGWSTTSIVHLPRYAPRVVLGAEAVFKEVKTAQGQQLQQQSVQQQGQSSGSYVVRDDATVMQQVCQCDAYVQILQAESASPRCALIHCA